MDGKSIYVVADVEEEQVSKTGGELCTVHVCQGKNGDNSPYWLALVLRITSATLRNRSGAPNKF